MGFWEDVAGYSNPITALPYGLVKNYGGGPAPAPEAPIDRRHTFVPRASRNQSISDLINPIYNTEGARNYGNVFDQAYQNLGQPLRDTNRDDVYVGGTRGLASSFADKFYEKTGKLPSESQVRQFVSENLNPAFAEKFILGMAPDQLNSLAESYISLNPEIISPAVKPPEQTQIGDLVREATKKQDELYGDVEKRAIESVNRNFAPLRARAAEEEAALGRLRSPVSLAPGAAIPTVDAEQGKALSDVIGRIAENRAGGAIGGAQFLESLGAGERRAGEAQNNFLRNFGLAREQLRDARDESSYNRGLQRKGLELSEIIGRAQAGAGKRDWLDYLNAGLNVASTAGKIYSGFRG